MRHTRSSTVRATVVRMLAILAMALLGTTALAVLADTPANAAGRLSASSSLGGATAAASGATTFTVSGSGFQAIDGGFGGVYIGFGWVDGSGWGPSKGGATGRTYDYVPDDQSKNNKGYQSFVAFPGSSTAGEAQTTMGSDGSFRIQLTVPGPTFTGAGGKKIDCTKVTCGFLTWGAHGVRNGANEAFTPVTFQGGASAPAPAAAEAPAGQAPAANAQAGRPAAAGRPATRSRAGGSAPVPSAPAAGSAGPQAGDAASAGGADSEAGGDTPADDAPVAATAGAGTTLAAVIEVDRKGARAGGAMGFAAAGFWPGEQVYVVLGDGDAAVGPVVAGIDGEVAGVLSLPKDIEPGTHEIRAAGAGSGLEATERFAVRTDIAPTASSAGLSGSLSWVFLAIAALALLAAGALFIKRRQEAAAADPEEQPGGEDDPAAAPYDPSARPTTLLQEEDQR